MTLFDPTRSTDLELADLDMAKQQQQQQQRQPRGGAWFERDGLTVEVLYRIKEEQRRYLHRRRNPGPLPAGAPIHSIGDLVYFEGNTCWVVQNRIFVWEEPSARLRLELWLDHYSGPISELPSAFGSLQ